MGTGKYASQGEYTTVTVNVDGQDWYCRKSIDPMGQCIYEVALRIVRFDDDEAAKVWWPVLTDWDHGHPWRTIVEDAVKAARGWIGSAGGVESIFTAPVTT